MNENIMQLIRLGVDHVKKVPVTNFSGSTRNGS